MKNKSFFVASTDLSTTLSTWYFTPFTSLWLGQTISISYYLDFYRNMMSNLVQIRQDFELCSSIQYYLKFQIFQLYFVKIQQGFVIIAGLSKNGKICFYRYARYKKRGKGWSVS